MEQFRDDQACHFRRPALGPKRSGGDHEPSVVAVCLQTGVHRSGVDWKNLNSQRPPYTPQGAEYARLDGVRDRQLDMVLKRIENTPSSAPEFPYLVQTLAKNFDDFPEKPLDSGSCGCG